MNILTFDIEEWFHILDHDSTKTEKEWSNYEYRLESNMDRILDLLDRKNQKATFFVLGWVAREFPQILKKIDNMGFEIATHSDRHQLAYEQNRVEFTNDLKKSIGSIEEVIGKKVRAYRAPGFSIKEENKWVLESLVENGIEIDCSIFPAKRSHGGFENYGYARPSIIEVGDSTLKEFPINLMDINGKNIIFSGGGYFRFLPYPLIKRMMKKSDYVMTYFHPRDFDSTQPMIDDLSLIRKFKSYYGLTGAFSKLENLINDFEFLDIAQADKLIHWESQKIIRLNNENTLSYG
jgi:polysaccharide deacetylase family protein (PEP-CTERM system associated)